MKNIPNCFKPHFLYSLHIDLGYRNIENSIVNNDKGSIKFILGTKGGANTNKKV